jgi:hypothetical protein
MSADKKQTSTDKSNPYILPKIPDSVTMEQVRLLGEMHMQQYRDFTEMYKGVADHVKRLLDETHLKWWVIGAGLGGIIETIRFIGYLIGSAIGKIHL